VQSTINTQTDFYNSILATDNEDPDRNHWKRSCTAWTFLILLTEFGQQFATKDTIYAYYWRSPPTEGGKLRQKLNVKDSTLSTNTDNAQETSSKHTTYHCPQSQNNYRLLPNYLGTT
jgi:hypothetical protein